MTNLIKKAVLWFCVLIFSIFSSVINAEEVVWTQYFNIGQIQNQAKGEVVYVWNDTLKTWFLPGQPCQANVVYLWKTGEFTGYEDILLQISLAASQGKKIQLGGVCHATNYLKIRYIRVKY